MAVPTVYHDRYTWIWMLIYCSYTVVNPAHPQQWRRKQQATGHRKIECTSPKKCIQPLKTSHPSLTKPPAKNIRHGVSHIGL